jgi:hypothetical protein
VTMYGLRRVFRLRRIGLGQGVFGDYNTGFQSGGLSEGYGRKAIYYERTRRKRQEKAEREMTKQLLRSGHFRGT